MSPATLDFLAGQFFTLLGEGAPLATTLPHLLSTLGRAVNADAVQVLAPEGGSWKMVCDWGPRVHAPTDLLSDVLDRGEQQSREGWHAVAIGDSQPGGPVLACRVPDATSETPSCVAAGSRLLSRAWRVVAARDQLDRRLERLNLILGITSNWNQTGELEPLLHQLATSAAKLLGADRASVFLWDKPNRLLVGRPALGMPNNELRVPDDQGVVGQVLQTALPRRVSTPLDQREINRSVDQSTGYQTRTLIAVPMFGPIKNDGKADGKKPVIGVFEVLNKFVGSFSDDDEAALVEVAMYAAKAIEATQQLGSLLATQRKLVDQAAGRVELIGDSPAMNRLRTTIDRVAQTDLAVLILGENGAGKEVVAQSIHYQSRRRLQPFIAVNCAAIAETLLESELFGHEKGAFTDAREARIGKFELASGGTLFLDEIGDLSPGGQAKLLRVLEEKIVVRVGGSKPIHTDVRVLAATNQDLADMVRQKRFRQDLFFRLNIVTLDLPALRDRGADVLLLAEHFLNHFCRQAKRGPMTFLADAKAIMQTHRWPGNVRELRNLMERLAYLQPTDFIAAEDMALDRFAPPTDAPPLTVPQGQPLSTATDAFQTAYIKQAIAQASNNMSDAAERLGLHRSNLYRKMRQLGMDTKEEV